MGLVGWGTVSQVDGWGYEPTAWDMADEWGTCDIVFPPSACRFAQRELSLRSSFSSCPSSFGEEHLQPASSEESLDHDFASEDSLTQHAKDLIEFAFGRQAHFTLFWSHIKYTLLIVCCIYVHRPLISSIHVCAAPNTRVVIG